MKSHIQVVLKSVIFMRPGCQTRALGLHRAAAAAPGRHDDQAAAAKHRTQAAAHNCQRSGREVGAGQRAPTRGCSRAAAPRLPLETAGAAPFAAGATAAAVSSLKPGAPPKSCGAVPLCPSRCQAASTNSGAGLIESRRGAKGKGVTVRRA